jgi:SAM-dependent methyltransferase
MKKRVERPSSVREGYDRWSETYDATLNPVVALDRRFTMRALQLQAGETVLDAGCGTGSHLSRLGSARNHAVGLDFSRGMLRVAQRAAPQAMLAQADLNDPLPIHGSTFDAILCSLVSEHLTRIHRFFRECFAGLRRGGRLVFSAFHPEPARAGVEANFEENGTEYRLGAEPYSIDDYLNGIYDAGFNDLEWTEYGPDEQVIAEVPWAAKYVGRPLLLLVVANRAA